MPNDLFERYRELWQSAGTSLNVFQFLNENDVSHALDELDLLLLDQLHPDSRRSREFR